jgi:hypothetical protein
MSMPLLSFTVMEIIPHQNEQHRVIVFGIISIAMASVPHKDIELLFVVGITVKGSASNDGKGTTKGPS